MLVLTRKAGEAICIGDDIEVRIVAVRGQKVRLAIEAPRDVSVRRSELPAPDSATASGVRAPRLAREAQPQGESQHQKLRSSAPRRRAVG